MPQSLAQVYLHVIFSTHGRRPFLADDSLRDETHHFIGGVCNQCDCPVLRVGGVADHVHVLCRLSRTLAVGDLVRELKRESSQWLKTKDTATADFSWQNGYGAFSVSPSHVDGLREYIEAQQEHHRVETFQDELRRLLTKYGLAWDERYLWD